MTVVSVIGASGALGQCVLRQLDRDPRVEAVVAIDRRNLPARHSKAEFFRADAVDADLAPLFAGVQVVVNLAWDVGPAGGVTDVPSSNLVALGNVLAAADEAGIEQLIYSSSATVYGAWPDNPIPIPEDAPIRPNPGFPYAVQKADAEAVIQAWNKNHPEISVAVFRPSVVVSGKTETPLARAVSGIRALRAREASHPVQFLHVDDFAAAITIAIDKQLKGTFNVAPDGYLRDVMARELAGAPVTRGFPERVLPWLTAAAWQLGLVEAAPAVLPYTEHPWVIANDRLRAEGWEPRYGNEEALVEWQPASQWGGISPAGKRKLVGGGIALSSVTAIATTAAVIMKRRRRS